MKRYHPLLVALHWIVAIMILMALVIGGPMLAQMDNSDPAKASAAGLGGHMAFGMVIGLLLVIRLITRVRSEHPPKADTGNALLNFFGIAAHWGLYFLAFAMVASGLGIALSAGLFDIVYGGSGAPLPETFHVFPPRIAHGIVAKLLLVLILLHIAGWAYHQFFLRDKLFGRMWFGKRR